MIDISPGVCHVGRGCERLLGRDGPRMIDIRAWPKTVPVQTHYTNDDPFRSQSEIDAFDAAVRKSGAQLEQFDYPGAGHLFTDQSMREEYQPKEAALLWQRALRFLGGLPGMDTAN